MTRVLSPVAVVAQHKLLHRKDWTHQQRAPTRETGTQGDTQTWQQGPGSFVVSEM